MTNTELQIQLANTYHQREVADLQAAGLNPILSAHNNPGLPNIMSGDGLSESSSGSGRANSGKRAIQLAKMNPVYQSLDVTKKALNTVNTAISGPFNWLLNNNSAPNSAMSLVSGASPTNSSPTASNNSSHAALYQYSNTLKKQVLNDMRGKSWQSLPLKKQNAILKLFTTFFPQYKAIVPVNSAVYNLTH